MATLNKPSSLRTLTQAQRRALEILAPLLPRDAYLAGGVAVALYHSHRASHDLDFFVKDTDPLTLNDELTGLEESSIVSRAEGTLYCSIHGVPVSVLRYSPDLLRSVNQMEALVVAVASQLDLACMKLNAISQRGARRDFWDLHVLLERDEDLASLLESFEQKYPGVDVGHVVRSLAYFGDADAEPSPRGLSDEVWTEIKVRFEAAIRRLS